MKSKENFKNFNKFNKKKKGFQTTWNDSDSSSSDEEEATETVNVCSWLKKMRYKSILNY